MSVTMQDYNMPSFVTATLFYTLLINTYTHSIQMDWPVHSAFKYTLFIPIIVVFHMLFQATMTLGQRTDSESSSSRRLQASKVRDHLC